MKLKTLLLAFFLMLLSVAAFAQGTKEPYVVIKDGIATFYFDSDKSTHEGALPIQSTYDDSNWPQDTRNSVTKVVFDASFKECTPTSCAYWFYKFINLTEISGMKENLNTANVERMWGMFYQCSSLTTLDVSGFDTKNVTNMGYMFYNCSSLTALDLSGFDTQNVYHMGYMFHECNKLATIKVTGFDTQNVIDMSDMFYHCSSLTSLDVSSFDTRNVTHMWDMFEGCSSLTSLDLRSFDASKVNKMDRMFFNCSSLTSLVFGSFNPVSVTDMSLIFYNCSSLTSLDLSSFNTNIAVDMRCMFEGCSRLTTLDLSGFKTDKVTNMVQLFNNCKALKTIIVGDGWLIDAVTTSENMFQYCYSLIGGQGTVYNTANTDATYARVDGGSEAPGYLTLKGEPMFEAYAVFNEGTLTFYFNKSKPSGAFELNPNDKPAWLSLASDITKVVFDNSFADYCPYTCYSWFNGCSNLTEIVGIKNLNTEQCTSMKEMFKDCQSLESIDLTGFKINRVFYMSSMFDGCTSLTSLDFSSFDATSFGVRDLSCMFRNCSSLTSLDLSAFHPSIVQNMSGMFDGCSKLATIDISGFYFSSVTDMSAMFRRTNLSKLVLSDNFRTTSKVTDFSSMFEGCANLEELDLRQLKTSSATNLKAMFKDCSQLNSIYVSSSWSSATVTESENMFSGCSKLEGNNGTVYNESHTDGTYAHLDGGESNPGYFSHIPKAYVVIENGIATFYYNNKDIEGALPIQWSYNDSNWPDDIRCSVTKVIFDASFKNYKPYSCSCWFYNFRNLTEISGMKENLNTTNVTDMQQMFFACVSLTVLDLSNFNTANVTNMFEMFYCCSSLNVIFVGDGWSTAHSASRMFDACNKLYGGKGTAYSYHSDNDNDGIYAKIDGGKENPGYFTKSGEPVYDPCYALVNDGVATFYCGPYKPADALPMRTEMDDKNWTADIRSSITKVVFDKSFINFQPTKLAYWFNSMSNLQEISGLENLKTENVESMNQMFQFCKKLKTLDLSGFNTAKVTTMDKMFLGCEKLQCIYVGDNWITSAVTKSSGMFSDCYTLFGGKGTAYNEDKIDVAYAHIDGGTENPGYLTKSGDPAFWPYHAYVVEKDSTLTFYYDTNTPEGAFDLNPNSDNWRSLKKKIIKVVFDDSFKNYRPTSCALWFDGFRKLTTIIGIKENLNTEDVTDMRYMFRECNAVASLDLSGFNTENVTNMAEMFYGCIALPTLDLSSFNTGKVENMSKMFTNTNLEAVFVGDGWSTAAVTASADMFQFCYLILGGKGSSPNILQVYDATYAKIDGGAENPGYFTKSGEPAFQRVIVSIQVSTLPQTEYAFGQNFSAENGKLTLTYNTGETKKVKLSEATITGYDNTKNGEQTLKVEYQGVETTFTVKVGTTTTPVSSITDQSSIKVWCYNSTIYIENAPDTKYTIIDTNGRLITTSTTKSTKEEIKINKTGLLIVIIDNQSFKLMN